MRPFATLLVGGTVAVVALNFAWGVLVPVLSAVMGIVMTVVKFAVIGGIVYLLYSVVFKRRKRNVEVEVEVED